MESVKRNALTWFFILFLCCCLPVAASAQDLGSLDGTWEGTITYQQNPEKQTSYKLRLIINEKTAKVVQLLDTGDHEVRPGKFVMTRLLTNAIISTVDSGTDKEGRWVETWVFAVTLKDKDTLWVGWNRLVNNINLPVDAPHSKFFFSAQTTLTRVQQ